MNFGSEPGFQSGSVGSLSPGASRGNYDNWVPNVNDQAIWATEDEYKNWNSGILGEKHSNSNYVLGTPSRPGPEPPSKKSRNSQGVDLSSNRAKATGRVFFKTKMCSKFRAGVCPYITNCNFAHGMEELRRPQPNWQDVVGAQDEDREEHQIPTVTSVEPRGETQRSFKGRHCKKFYTEEGCPYGYNCTFLHDEQSRSRESVAISVSPSVNGGNGGGYAGTVHGGGGSVVGGSVGGGVGGNVCGGSNVLVVGGGGIGLNEKPSNWKTRICNKWETTGNCPFGSKCHFAHGLAELHNYGGGLMETESRDSSAPMESKQGTIVAAAKNDAVVASNVATPRTEYHHVGPGFPSQRPYNAMQQVGGHRSTQRWKGPDRISKIYGDWIDDIE